MRVTYGRELKFQEYLKKLQIRTFIPMQYRQVAGKDGKNKKTLVPAVSNLCFVYSTREVLDEIRSHLYATLPVHYIWDRGTSVPIVVPDKAMEDFIKVSSTMDENLIYMSEVSPVLRAGQKVRVKSGPFSGVEGTVVRIKKMRRVMVELPGMFALATTYIPSEYLEIV